MHEVIEKIREVGPTLRAEAIQSDKDGKLTKATFDAINQTGIMRMLQPTSHGGYESHMCDFMEAAMEVGKYASSAGWVCGVVGIHPWEIALMDPKLQDEIWGENPDTWTASPYAPAGRATPVEGGFLFTGQWSYSTGTDWSEWVILGGIVTDENGEISTPPDIRHFVIPRKDYEIVEDSWNVLGLKGTGSKDVRMKDVFIPDYRVVEAAKMNAGGYEDRQPGKALYQIKFPVAFSAAINSASVGIAEGALEVFRDYMEKRVSVVGTVAKTDPIQLMTYGEAAADVASARVQLLHDMRELTDHIEAGGEVTMTQRLTIRRNGVRAVRRALDAIDRLYKIAGSQSVHERLPNERYWRDCLTALSHICNVSEPIYVGWASNDFGGDFAPSLFV